MLGLHLDQDGVFLLARVDLEKPGKSSSPIGRRVHTRRLIKEGHHLPKALTPNSKATYPLDLHRDLGTSLPRALENLKAGSSFTFTSHLSFQLNTRPSRRFLPEPCAQPPF
ncbi:hypothetical protein Adt_35867 [Abeliophyllum distichum]|uniref:Uncharacterized protein n=1 Tax=Abeliophyllum distichum TaxID=126358 RepID=A0ABD1QFY9_9LAMI